MSELCPDCGSVIQVPKDIEEHEVVSCPGCGLELEYINGVLIQLTIEGEDYGE